MKKRQVDALKTTLLNIGQIVAGFVIYAFLLGSLFVGNKFGLSVSALVAAIYVFITSFYLSKRSIKKGIDSALCIAAPMGLFALLGIMDWVLYAQPGVFLLWLGGAAAFLLIGLAGVFVRVKTGHR